MKKHFFIIASILAFAISSVAYERPDVGSFPYPGFKDLAKKAEWLQEDLRKYNLQLGIVMPRVLQPPEGKKDLSNAHQEDGGNRSGPYLAALSFQYATTHDPKIREWADETFDAIEMLELVTDVPGCLARSFNLADTVQRHETWFFFPGEWHQSTSYPQYRWVGDPSSDTITNIFYGLSVYYDLCARGPEKKTSQKPDQPYCDPIARIRYDARRRGWQDDSVG